MNTKIKKIDPTNSEDVEMINRIGVYAFHNSPSEEELEKRLDVADYRSNSDQFLLFQDDEAVAAATIHQLTQHVRSRIVNVGGIATVGSLPHARRKGYVSKLMRTCFDQMRENKQALSLLHPFRESFYYRYGYITLPDRVWVDLVPETLTGLSKIELNSDARISKLEDKIDEVEKFMEKIQVRKPGMVMFDSKFFQKNKETSSWVVEFLNKEQEIIGLIQYEITGYEKSMIVNYYDFINSEGKYSILQFFMNHIDHVKRIRINIPRTDLFENWLSDLDYKVTHKPGAMARIIDITLLSGLELEVNDGESVVVSIRDNKLEWNNGSYKIASINGKLKIEETNEETETWIDIRTLAALVYGNYNLNDFQVIGLCNLNAEEKIKLDQIFRTDPHQVLLYF